LRRFLSDLKAKRLQIGAESGETMTDVSTGLSDDEPNAQEPCLVGAKEGSSRNLRRRSSLVFIASISSRPIADKLNAQNLARGIGRRKRIVIGVRSDVQVAVPDARALAPTTKGLT
jgi:hypothetical protein